jgi:hypothetical protein
MSCATVQKSLSAFLDRALSREESESVAQHLACCRQCVTRSRELMELRRLLRNLPATPVPARLASELNVIASHELARRRAGLWERWTAGLRLAMDNLMRPVAIPFAGGVVSAFLLFSMITPPLTIRAADARTDVSANLLGFYKTQGLMIDAPPFGFRDDIEIILTIDKNGQIADYSSAQGKVSREMIDNIGNMLLFTSFEPATTFGRPTSGKIRVTFKKGGEIYVVRG